MFLGGREALGFVNNFAKFGFKFQYGICGVNSGISVIIGCLSIPEDDSFGFAIDTSASDKFLVSARKVYYSNCYLGSIVLNRRKRVGEIVCDLAEINAVEANFEYYLKGENKPSWFFESSKEVSLFPAFDVRVEQLRETFTPSLVVVRASSTDCQHYFAGLPTAESLNIARIRSIFPNREIFFDLHPLA
ncbi:MAG TPA: hypothetical protein VE954_03500 [Oligoflexus sp.]|uniref:hypothetical protein n=1 Tax=Oligoflexus sp. TaxID=1971216 RepID=UPI002D69AD92|nr:hypothetical protein [Oligoflexus sp.]HYX32152.1 hypothetical protein [Oligoflexus sp.]